MEALLNQLLNNKLVYGKSSYGVHVSESKNEVSYLLTKLSLDQGQLSIVIQHSYDSLAELKEEVGSCPVYFSLNSPKIIHKSYDISGQLNIYELLKSNFPNADISNLYYQYYRKDEFSGIVSVVNKKHTEYWTGELNKFEIRIVKFYLGPIAMNTYATYESRKNVLLVNSQELEFAFDGLVSIKNSKKDENNIGIEYLGEPIEPQYVVSYFNAIQFFVGVGDVFFSDDKFTSENIIKSFLTRYKGFLMGRLGKWLLIVFLLAIGLNIGLIQWNSSLKQKNAKRMSEIKKEKALLNEIDKKKGVLRKIQPSLNSNLVYYSDQLAKSLVPNIRWKNVVVFPLLSEDENNINLSNDVGNRIILVKGACKDPNSVSAWVANINNMQWVAHISNPSYTWSNRDKEGNFEFQIQIEK